MPTPGFPDWLGPGAIVREQARRVQDPSSIRFVVMDVEMELPGTTWDGSGVTAGSYVIAMMPLDEHRHADRIVVNREGLHTVDLSAFLDLYDWVGEYLMPDGSLVGVRTTMPVQMTATALRPMDQMVIQGSGHHDGTYLVSTVTTHSPRPGPSNILPNSDQLDISLVRAGPEDFARIRQEVFLRLARQLRSSRSERAANASSRADLVPLEHPFEDGPYEARHRSQNSMQMIDPSRFREALAEVFDPRPSPASPEDALEEVFPMYADMVDAEQPQPIENEEVAALRTLFVDIDVTATIRDGGLVEPERDVPHVDTDQVWLLPQPNEGLWRTTLDPHRDIDAEIGLLEAGAGPPRNARGFMLTHAKEPDRTMRCTATWLVNHGVRQQPTDPRTNRSGPVIGQLWELEVPRYKNIRRWRIHSVEGDRVCLMSADRLGKRIYWATTRLTSYGTFVGDGIPRRTAFERILEDDDD